MRLTANWVHVEYGVDRSAVFSESCSLIPQMFELDVENVLIQNDRAVLLDSENEIYGSNTLREFSAWNEGIGFCLEKGRRDADWWIFSNDTFSAHRHFWGSIGKGFRSAFQRKANEMRPIVIGDILPGNMFTTEPGEMMYFSTYFFMINSNGLRRLEFDLCRSAPLDWVSVKKEVCLTSEDCPASVSSFLERHLLHPESALAWKDAARLCDANLDGMRSKAKSVILEHSLSRRCFEEAIELESIIDRSSWNTLRLRRSLEARLEKLVKKD